jgi:gliding motility-associated-like protein
VICKEKQTVVYDTICLNNTYTKYGFSISANTLQADSTFEFRDTLSNTMNCDSIVILYLTVNHLDTTTLYDTICQNNTYTKYGFDISENELQTAGTFEFRNTLLNIMTCDSILILHLTVNQFDITKIYDTICPNNAYTKHGFTISADELQTADTFEFRDTLSNTIDCDSIVILYLTVNQFDITKIYDTICPNNSYSKYGFTISVDELQTLGTFEFQDTIPTSVDCDSLIILYLTVSDTVEPMPTVFDSLLIWVPSAFSPNGDGLNDVFKPVIYKAELLKTFGMFIYDRWGNLIFTTQDYSTGWDGNDASGRNFAEGVYSCIIRITDVTGKEAKHYTSITLLR